MVLGEMKMVTGRFGLESTCEPYENADLESQLAEAVSNIHGEISDYEMDDEMESEDNSIPRRPVREELFLHRRGRCDLLP